MKRIKNTFQNHWENTFVIVISFFILIIAMLLRQPLYGIFGEQNYVTIHLLIEIVIITIAFSIAIHSWMVFPYHLSSYRLWIGSIFFSISLLETAHVISFKGMPFFLSESSAYKATWFFIFSRLTEVLGMLAIIFLKDRLVSSKYRLLAYGFAAVYSSFWMIAVFSPVHWLPELVLEGVGTTRFKNNLQYAGIFLQFLIIFFVTVRFRSKEIFNLMLIVSTVYLIISDYFFTTYKNVYDIHNFVGHWFQLAGFYFLLRAVYQNSVGEPFHKQKESEIRLKKHEKFLGSITSQMGEGLIVLDRAGHVSFMNFEAERILQWKQEEVLGKNVQDFIHPSNNLFGEFSMAIGCTRNNEDQFIRKNGTSFPVSYVATPFLENEKVDGFIMFFHDITQQKKDQEVIQYMAFYDELTKLPNLRFMKEKWSETISAQLQKKAAVLVLDIDRFKKINEALGHDFGDLILKFVAARLQEQLTADMFLGRLTGDEYALILSSVDHENEIIKIIDQIQNSLKEPVQVLNLLLNVQVSIGAAIYPGHGRNFEELLQHANMALMEAQQQNKSFYFYQPSMHGKALDRLVFENDLRHALSRNELQVVYQPQVDLHTGKIYGFEALLRWHHPVKGLISPIKFISIAEETGLIIPIGEWVLRTACKQLKQWHDQGLHSLVMSVNLSIRQFYQQNLVETVKDILNEANLSPQYLELEITESMMMNVDHSIKTLKALKQLGVRIAIDDFGTGYSSLSYLKDLPVNRLKIDQSFIRDLLNEDDSTVVSMIILLGQHLHLEVIAEGVETSAQMEFLRMKHCHQVQGYLFSKPLPPDELIRRFDSLQQRAGASIS